MLEDVLGVSEDSASEWRRRSTTETSAGKMSNTTAHSQHRHLQQSPHFHSFVCWGELRALFSSLNSVNGLYILLHVFGAVSCRAPSIGKSANKQLLRAPRLQVSRGHLTWLWYITRRKSQDSQKYYSPGRCRIYKGVDQILQIPHLVWKWKDIFWELQVLLHQPNTSTTAVVWDAKAIQSWEDWGFLIVPVSNW